MDQGHFEEIGIDPKSDIRKPPAPIETGWGKVRYYFSRALDFKKADEKGQDYLAFRYGSNRMVFAVCDGVSQSFYGDIASYYIGTNLISWLWELEEFSDENTVQFKLYQFLQDLIPKCKELVDQKSLPENTPVLLKEALEEKRAYGSETTFVCGIINPRNVQEKNPGHLFLAWMGNTVASIIRENGGKELPGQFTDHDRWSSVHGIKGNMNTWSGNLLETQHLIVYTDGFNEYADQLVGIEDKDLVWIAIDSQESTNSDDLALLDIWFNQVIEPEIIRVNFYFLGLTSDKNSYQLRWKPVKSAIGYQIQESETPEFEDARYFYSSDCYYNVNIGETNSTGAERGTVYYRVRAYGCYRYGLWSRVKNVCPNKRPGTFLSRFLRKEQ